MKYLLLFALIPSLCNATMTAKEAAARVETVKEKELITRDRLFVELLPIGIKASADEGDCKFSTFYTNVTPSVVQKEVKKLKRLGYIVIVPTYNDDKTIEINWCVNKESS